MNIVPKDVEETVAIFIKNALTKKQSPEMVEAIAELINVIWVKD